MKKMLSFLLFVFVLVGSLAAQSLVGKTMYVSVKSAPVKSSTWFFASTRVKLAQGAQVTVLQDKGKWLQVRSGGNVTGWMNSSGLSTKRVLAVGVSTSASASELALAGKGFNQEVEDLYKTEAPLNYAAVDAAEATTVPDDELFIFIQSGHLQGGEE
jgi:hypothetical protein